MAEYRYKHDPNVVVEATRWFKNGDHPNDECENLYANHSFAAPVAGRTEGRIVRYFRHPAIPGHFSCVNCDQKIHDHGWLDYAQLYGILKSEIGGEFDGEKVCPGNWVVREGRAYHVLTDKAFTDNYVPKDAPPEPVTCVPCPFCGYVEPQDYTVEFMELDDEEYFYVTCTHCGAEGPPAEGDAVHAVEAWEERYDANAH